MKLSFQIFVLVAVFATVAISLSHAQDEGEEEKECRFNDPSYQENDAKCMAADGKWRLESDDEEGRTYCRCYTFGRKDCIRCLYANEEGIIDEGL